MYRAYEGKYLEDARRLLGGMMDCAVHDCGLDGDGFFNTFLQSGLAAELERGNPWYIGRYTGSELVEEILFQKTGERRYLTWAGPRTDSPEYWGGWALAHVQWHTGGGFQNISLALPFSEVVSLYPSMHKEDISRFVQYAEAHMRSAWKSRLKLHREIRRLSQDALASDMLPIE